MKKIVSGFFACLGVLSSIFAVAEKFSEYRSIFLVLIGVCVGFFLGKISGNESNEANPGDNLFSVALLFLLPPASLIAVIVVVYVVGCLTSSILTGLLFGGGFLIFFVEIIMAAFVSCYESPDSNRKKAGQQEEKECKTKDTSD